MNIAALALLRDLKRSRKIIARKKKAGKPKTRKVTVKAKRASKKKTAHLELHNGTLGMVSTETLVREADWACRFLMIGEKMFAQEQWEPAMDAFFKAAAISTNIIFTGNVHEIKLPERVIEDMNCIINRATVGIKKIMKVVAVKKLIHHEREFHKGQPVETKGAAAWFKHFMTEAKAKK